jgi:hypothetical protein
MQVRVYPMKRWNCVWVLVALVLTDCAGNRKTAPVPYPAMAASANCSLEKLQQGRGIFVTQCAQCHELVAPADVKTSDWKLVVPGMCWNAGLTRADERLILNYVLAVKKHAPRKAAADAVGN